MRQAILDQLAIHSVLDPAGLATAQLTERLHRAGFDVVQTAVASQVKVMEKAGTIERDVHGRRCSRIALTDGTMAAVGVPPAAVRPGACKWCDERGPENCALHRKSRPAKPDTRTAPDAVTTPSNRLPATPEPTRMEIHTAQPDQDPLVAAMALASLLRGAAEDHVILEARYATLVDELAMCRAALMRAHEKIGSLERSNELLGNRLATRSNGVHA